FEAYFSLRRRTIGASIVEDAERTYSPISWSVLSISLLVVPSSFASSWTRGFATSLLSGSSRAGRTASGSRSSHLTAHDHRFEVSSDDTHYTESIRSTCFLWSQSPSGAGSGPVRPGARSAVEKARFARALFQHAAESWIQAPRPGILRSASTTIRSSSALSTARRNSCDWGSLRRQAMHIRIGSRGACSAVDTGPVYSTARNVPAGRPAAGRGRPPARSASGSAGDDVDLPVGEAGGEARVLPLLADRQRQLVRRDGGPGGLRGRVEHLDGEDLRGRQGMGDELSRLVGVVDDVDLLLSQLRHDGAHARAQLADARAL